LDLGDAEALLHPLGHRLDATSARVGQADEFQQLVALGRATAGAGQALVQLEHLVSPRPAGKAEELGEVAQLRARRPGARRRARDRRSAGRRAYQAAADLHQRGLAGAVGAEQPDQLALLDREADAAQRLDAAAVALGETVYLQSGRHGGQRSRGFAAAAADVPSNSFDVSSRR
jgi:hypothetical protein